MARIGLKYPVMAPLLSETPSYGEGFIPGKAVSFNSTPVNNTAKLYADDSVAEVANDNSGGTVQLGTDDLTTKNYAQVLGHNYDEATDSVIVNTRDQSGYYGVGAYATLQRGGVYSYLATWYFKVKFKEPSDENATKAETTNFGTSTLEGDYVTLDNGDLKTSANFATEQDAIDWLNNFANITEA